MARVCISSSVNLQCTRIRAYRLQNMCKDLLQIHLHLIPQTILKTVAMAIFYL